LCGALLAALALIVLAADPSSAFADSTPPAQSSAAEAALSVSRLDALVEEAMAHSPVIEAARRKFEALTKVPTQVATLPDPQVALQEFTVGGPRPLEGYETSDFYYTGLGISQDIPWPSKLRTRRMMAEHESELARQAYEAVRRSVAEKVRESYYELFFLKEVLEILNRTHDELQRIERITEERYRVGQGLEQDVTKAQLEMTSVLKEIEMRREEQGMRQAELKAVVGRDAASPDIAVGDVRPSAAKLNLADLERLADERSPDIATARVMEMHHGEALTLAREGYAPDFSIGYMYQKTGPGFRDYYMLTMGAKIPLYFWRKQTPAIEQAAIDVGAARADVRARELEVHSALQSALIASNTAEHVMTIYREGLIPQAEATESSAMIAYRVGKADFQTLVSAVIDRLQLDEGFYRALADHEIAAAKIHEITGATP
jgi:outer membrane protein, heavy metal efflux system